MTKTKLNTTGQPSLHPGQRIHSPARVSPRRASAYPAAIVTVP